MSGGQELCAKLQCRSDGADESAEVASEMVKHLKKLTQNVRELETTIHAADDHGSSVRNNRAEHTSTRQCFGNQVYNTFPQDQAFWDNYPLRSLDHGQGPRSVTTLSSVSDHNLSELPSAARRHAFQDGITNWITWKWRWAASNAR